MSKIDFQDLDKRFEILINFHKFFQKMSDEIWISYLIGINLLSISSDAICAISSCLEKVSKKEIKIYEYVKILYDSKDNLTESILDTARNSLINTHDLKLKTEMGEEQKNE